MSSFHQYVIEPFEAGETIRGSLDTSWDEMTDGHIAITRPMFRHMMNRKDNPSSFVVRPTHKRYEFAAAYLVKHGQVSSDHIAKFAKQAEVHAYRKAVTTFAEEIAKGLPSIRKFIDGLK